MASWFLVKLAKSLRREGREMSFSVFGTVRNLREQRMGCVQTGRQYEFVYKMLKWFLDILAQDGCDKENYNGRMVGCY